ncbi:ABC transporter ATP-binding protein [Acidiferrimicrobium sp. IK]|uniref:ABC transporter ATP-binding protein n=1 Tax=Acidiferrimicrobium sp. IK TaxID=2871700 RepID=UPI0021CB6606|nr:ABC transporter ATP-binding protein [Acidiferrimicrobium sp. IK]MCU4186722.1 ABC transporter ATP-binding protein [Acidiferrimicrobium sp. IK]
MTATEVTTPALRATGLTQHYPIRGAGGKKVVHAVDDVSLELWPGQVTAVVGESGSGKSTLARILARLVAPTAGQLWLDGAEVPLSTRRGSRGYRSTVQLILQDPFSSLNPVHTVGYHLARPLRIHRMAERSATDKAVAALLERVKLTPPSQYAGKLPHELSGGQLQRVAIARCLAVQPRVLLADEPVSMLDVSIRLGVLNLLEEICQEERLAVLYVTHDLASARYLATSIMVMYAGQVVESGPALDVVDRPAHPYTQLLLSAAADPERTGPAVLTTRGGAPPSLIDPPTGCRFHLRCPHAMAVCSTDAPPSVDVGGGQHAACWLHAESGTRAGSALPGARPPPQAS